MNILVQVFQWLWTFFFVKESNGTFYVYPTLVSVIQHCFQLSAPVCRSWGQGPSSPSLLSPCPLWCAFTCSVLTTCICPVTVKMSVFLSMHQHLLSSVDDSFKSFAIFFSYKTSTFNVIHFSVFLKASYFFLLLSVWLFCLHVGCTSHTWSACGGRRGH